MKQIKQAGEGQLPKKIRPLLFTTLFFALLIYTAGELAYRFTLPTDGWMVNSDGYPGLIYVQNILGENSTLKPGDRVMAVEGVPAIDVDISESLFLQEAWRPGASIIYTVLREGQELELPVTLTNWQFDQWVLNRLLDPVLLVDVVSSLVVLVIAAVVFFRGMDNLAAGPFLIVIAFLSLTSVSETMPFGFPVWTDSLAFFFSSRINIFQIAVVFPSTMIAFALAFPRPKPILQRYPWIPSAVFLFSALLLLATYGGSPISWYVFLFLLFVSLVILVHNAFTMRDPVSRAQVRWGVTGMVIGIGLLAVSLAANTFDLVRLSVSDFTLIGAISTTIIGLMISVAIARYRLFDIDILIRRTLSYAILTGILGFVYFGGVVLLQNIFGSLSGSAETPLITVISTLTIAALFNPLRTRVQDFIDRRFYRQKFNAERILAEFSVTVRDEVDIASLSNLILEAVDRSVKPESASLWLREQRQ